MGCLPARLIELGQARSVAGGASRGYFALFGAVYVSTRGTAEKYLMPTYEYRCTACNHDFEKFQRMSEEPGAECPQCGAASERRLSGGAGLLFKGSGFYITDYRSDGYKQAAKADTGDSGKSSDAKPESKPESKPEPKAEAKPAAKPSSSASE